MPRHIEQPAPRHSNPASVKTRSSPSRSACCFTANEPGTTSARSPSATLRPPTTPAATRRSSIREFVHEPMKIVSGRISRIGVPGARSMYARARVGRLALRPASSNASGSGTTSSIVTDCAGFVPQLTYGRRLDASIVDLRVEGGAVVGGKRPPVVQRRLPRRRPWGACGRPST